MVDCGLNKNFMQHFAEGFTKNTSIQQLVLSENNFADSESIKYLSDAMILSKNFLSEINLHRCGLTNESAKHIAAIINQKYKLRSINLSNNGITDEGARDILAAIQVNPYLVKIRIDLNPIRTHLLREIENIANQNS